MNLLHLKYAVEIAESGSMTKAAENLYTAQPNLSRAIRELESSLGIEIFKRTSKGIFPTAQGEEFLADARRIIEQVDAVESRYRGDGRTANRFSISAPRASYIGCAFTEFVRANSGDGAEFVYNETNALRAVSNIIENDYHLGILRYPAEHEHYFKSMLDDKGMEGELIWDFDYRLLMNAENPLAKKDKILRADLAEQIELSHADTSTPAALSAMARQTRSAAAGHIYLCERSSQMDLLSRVDNAFMWVSPVPTRLLELYSLTIRPCFDSRRRYRDLLIYRREYLLSALDKAFIDALTKCRRELAEQ